MAGNEVTGRPPTAIMCGFLVILSHDFSINAKIISTLFCSFGQQDSSASFCAVRVVKYLCWSTLKWDPSETAIVHLQIAIS